MVLTSSDVFSEKRSETEFGFRSLFFHQAVSRFAGLLKFENPLKKMKHI
jgi:hypothetical protein